MFFKIFNKLLFKFSKWFGYLAFVTLASCTEEEKLDFPIVQTGEVVEITPSGVVFHGKIMNQGNEPILEHGFVWDSKDSPPNINDGYVKLLGSQTSNLFSAEITGALLINEIYYVRAFVRNENQIVYGRQVEFESLGSLAPKIIDFNPKVATWGDTIVVEGNNFGHRLEDNKVKIGVHNLTIIEESDIHFKVVIPETFNTTGLPIEVSVIDNSQNGFSSDVFNLLGPEIFDFNPKEVDRRNEIIIYGKNFHPITEFNHVIVEENKLTVIESGSSYLRVAIPFGISHGTHKIKVNISGNETVSTESFMMYEPWSKIASYPVGYRKFTFSFSIGDKGYVGGGKDSFGNWKYDFWEYDPESNNWTKKANLPIVNYRAMAFATITKGYILKFSKLWQYDPLTDVWVQKSNFLGSGTQKQSGFTIGSNGYIGMGLNDYGSSIKEFWEYNEPNDNWMPKTDFIQPMENGIGFSFNNKGYFALGGVNGLPHNSVHEYDPINNSWKSKLDLSGEIEGIENQRTGASSFSLNDKVYFLSGKSPVTGELFSDIYEYDVNLNTIVKVVNIPSKPRAYAASFSIVNKGYVGLGYDISTTALKDFYKFDPSKVKR